MVRLVCRGDSVSATVQGTHDYRVKLWVEDRAIQYDCDCPIGVDGEFCKHCVAAGLAWFAERSANEADSQIPQCDVDLNAYLMAQSKKKLISMLLERAREDELYEQRLQMLAAQGESKAAAIESFRKALTGRIKRRRFVEYPEMRSYVREIESAADSVEGLLKDGHAGEVRELAERALRLVEKALNNVDDSDGYMRNVIDRFQELHYTACKAIKPDPIALAKFLLEWEVSGDWEVFYGAAETYADILGNSGLAAYRRFAEAEWEKVKPLNAREERAERFGRRFRVQQLMERYAKASGDIEALVAVKKKSLTGAVDYLSIARIYKDAGSRDAAIEWAERGAKAFPEHDRGLKDFLIAEYYDKGRYAESLARSWEKFSAMPILKAHQQLKKSAAALSEWEATREKALCHVRETLANRAKNKKSYIAWPYHSDHSPLVEILLWEKKPEEAWTEAACGGCTKALWLVLAEERGKAHPSDAADVYLRIIERTIQETNNAAYSEAVEMLNKVKTLKERLGHGAEFTRVLEAIRVRYKAKRKLMRLLNSEVGNRAMLCCFKGGRGEGVIETHAVWERQYD